MDLSPRASIAPPESPPAAATSASTLEEIPLQSKHALLDRFFYSGYGASMLEKIEESVDEPRRCTWWVRRLIDSAEMIDATYLVHGLRVFAAAPTHSGVVGLRALLQEAEADMQPAGRRARSRPATPTMTARRSRPPRRRPAANKPPFRRVTFAGVSSQRAAESGGSPPPAEPDDLAAAYPRLPSVAELCRQAPKEKEPGAARRAGRAPAASSPPPRRRQPPASPALPSAVRPRTASRTLGGVALADGRRADDEHAGRRRRDAGRREPALLLPCDARPRRLPPPRSTWAVPPPEPRRRGRAASHDLDLDLVPRKKIDSDLDLDLDLDLAASALDAAAVAAAESGAKARWWHALHGTTVLLGTGVLGVFSASVVLATMLGDACRRARRRRVQRLSARRGGLAHPRPQV